MPIKQWKDHLLKSSLPFEHLVAEVLEKNKWYVNGQYTYSRLNETGKHTDFSVDLHAFSEFTSKTHWLANIDLLIECKYASPGVRWIFLPYPTTSDVYTSCIKAFDQLANKRLSKHTNIEELDLDTRYCIRGISLFDNGVDENSITRGVSQLRYAMPRLATHLFGSVATDSHDEDIPIWFACPMMVTSAPIYILRDGLTLEDIYNADSLDAVVSEQNAVILWDRDSPDRENYSEGIYRELLRENSDVEKRISEYSEVYNPRLFTSYCVPPSLQSLKYAVRSAGDHVLVLNYNSLGSYLEKIRASVKKSLPKIKKFAELTYDQSSGLTLIKPAEPKGKKPSPRTAQ
jgi:hypothetical protein